MKKRAVITILIACMVFFAGALTAMAAEYFDTSQVSKGVIKVSYTSSARLKVQITHGSDTPYNYDLNNKGTVESFPLQMGNGAYKISLLENTSGNSYKVVATTTVNLNLQDANSVYLNSIQTVNYGVSPKAVAKAVELTKGTSDPAKKADILWDYMVKNNAYDYNKLATLPSTYVPAPDSTLVQKSGICYDFASLYAAMMRTQGIPCRLVKGYAPDYATGYHAWNEVYDSAKKQWITVDPTYDLQVSGKKTTTMTKAVDKYKKTSQY